MTSVNVEETLNKVFRNSKMRRIWDVLARAGFESPAEWGPSGRQGCKIETESGRAQTPRNLSESHVTQGRRNYWMLRWWNR